MTISYCYSGTETYTPLFATEYIAVRESGTSGNSIHSTVIQFSEKWYHDDTLHYNSEARCNALHDVEIDFSLDHPQPSYISHGTNFSPSL